MESLEKKLCPKCGEEIAAAAHKCKHCGTWIDKQCTVCGEWIPAKAMKCKHCGSWLNKFAKADYERSLGIKEKPEQTTDDDDESADRDAGCTLQIESVLVAFLASFYMGWVGVVICLIILQILLHIHTFRVWYCIIVSILWGIVGFSFGGVLGGIIGLGVSILFHYPAMKKGFDVD